MKQRRYVEILFSHWLAIKLDQRVQRTDKNRKFPFCPSLCLYMCVTLCLPPPPGLCLPVCPGDPRRPHGGHPPRLGAALHHPPARAIALHLPRGLHAAHLRRGAVEHLISHAGWHGEPCSCTNVTWTEQMAEHRRQGLPVAAADSTVKCGRAALQRGWGDDVYYRCRCGRLLHQAGGTR